MTTCTYRFLVLFCLLYFFYSVCRSSHRPTISISFVQLALASSERPVCPPQASCTADKLDETMARLVAVCREGDEDYPFLARQIPLHIDDSLTVNYLRPKTLHYKCLCC